jgi:virginiamycin B lyase
MSGTFLTIACVVASLAVGSAVAQTITGNHTEFTLQNSPNPKDIVAGPDGNLWFTEVDAKKIGRITTTGTVTEFSYPSSTLSPRALTVGPDGNLWFALSAEGDNNPKLARMTTTGTVTEFAITDVAATGALIVPTSMVVGPDNNLWLAATNRIVRSTPTGTITLFNTGLGQRYIAIGPEGAMWVVGTSSTQVGRLTTGGLSTFFSLTTDITTLGGAITRAPDDTLWISVTAPSNQIGRYSSTAGPLAGFALPLDGATVNAFTRGPDGHVWWATSNGKIGRVTVAGVPGSTTVPTATANLGGIATATNGTVWYTIQGATSKIGRFTPTGQTTVQAVPLRLAAVYPTSQPAQQSFLRFYNSGSSAGTVAVDLIDNGSGATLTTWTSPSIDVGAASQVFIGTIEGNLPNSSKPSTYSVRVSPQMTGFVQHALWRPSDGTLTNLSTCDINVTTSVSALINVHSSLLADNYPSSIVIHNTGSGAASASLGIYDARNGTRLGTYTTVSIAAGGHSIVPITSMEASTGVSPGSAIYHYVIKVEGIFSGYIQHLVNNKQAGVTSDMSAMCRLP